MRVGLLAALALCVVVGMQAGAQETPVFRTEARLVVLHATVRNDRGELVTDLARDAFTVFEGGKRQRIALFRRDDVPVTNDIHLLEAGLARVDSIGGTAMRDAIDAGERYLTERATRDRRILLVVTDGNDNASSSTSSQIQQLADERRVSIYAVGLLNDEDPSKAKQARHELSRLTETTGGVVYFPDTIDEIGSVAEELARQIRNQYTIAYQPTNQAVDGSYRSIKVTATGREPLTVRTRAGYRATAAHFSFSPGPYDRR